MLDKHGKEIKVGDAILNENFGEGLITAVGDHWYKAKWEKGRWEHVDDVVFWNQHKINIINQKQSVSIHEIKAKAEQELQAMVSKYAAAFNAQGFEMNVEIDFHSMSQFGGTTNQLVKS